MRTEAEMKHVGRMILTVAAVLVTAACDRSSNQPSEGASSDTYSRSSGKSSATAAHETADTTDTLAVPLNPDEQGASQEDLQITRHIRQTIASDPEFSAKAKNVKVVAVNGKVTLRGEVGSVQEQRAIASIARRATGAVSVDNQMEVKP